MIPPITRALNNPRRLNFCDSTKFQSHAVASLIIMNAVLRPVATEMDSSASDKQKHYSAAREFFHQAMCLMCHYLLSPLFEIIAFSAAKKSPGLKKEFGEFTTFKQIKDKLQSNGEIRRHNRLIAAKLKDGVPQAYQDLPSQLSGVLRMGSSIGTILALTIVAPTLNNYLLKPITKLLGLDSKMEEVPPPEVPTVLPD